MDTFFAILFLITISLFVIKSYRNKLNFGRITNWTWSLLFISVVSFILVFVISGTA